MTGDRINPPSDQLEQPKVAKDDNLERHRDDASRTMKAQEYSKSQHGETSESLNHPVFKEDFTKDGQIIKKCADRVNDHINQMVAHIEQQHADIQRLEEIPQQALARTKKKPLDQNLCSGFPKGLDPNQLTVDLIEQANKDISFLDLAIQAQLAEKSQRLLKKTLEEKQALKLQNQSLERQLKKYLQENEKLKRDNQENIELKEILKKAKPGLPPKVKEAYDQLQDLHSQATTEKKVYDQLQDLHSRATNDEHRKGLEEQLKEQKKQLSHLSVEYTEGLKKLLEHLSPQTLQDYTDRGVEFVAYPHLEDFTYGAVKDENTGKSYIQFPFPYKEGIRGTIMHAIELILDTEQLQDGTLPPRERRIDIMARVFRANDTLGEYGFPTKGYDLAKKHRKDYNDGICLAFREGRISKNTPKEECIEIGYEYAYNKLVESIKPPQGIPRIFSSVYPGGYFDERHRWEIHEGQRPVQEGSPGFDAVMKKMEMRRKNRENPVLTANILWNDTTKNTEIWAQPYYIRDGLRTLHPMNARGNHSIWAGEVEIDYETKTLLRLKDQSGHFRPFDKDNPRIMAEFALKEFKKRGYDTSTTMIELTAIEGGKDLKYENYKPRTFGDLRAIGWQTESEYYIEDFRQKQQDS